MSLVETEAIVLRTYNLAEADKIAVCLTRSAGLVRAVARGARRLKSRFGAGLEPFTIIALSYYEKEGRELVSLRQAEIVRSYFNLSGNMETVAVLAYLSELVIEFAPPHEPNEKLFRMVKACIEAAACRPSETEAIARYFEVWILRLAGFLPDLRHCAECGRRPGEEKPVSLDAEGKLRCGLCSEGLGLALSSEAYAQLRATQSLSPDAYAERAPRVLAKTWREMAQVTQPLIGRILERQPRALAVYAERSKPL
ncbi:MAG TPA: DNA repair protein RecO [Pyrinomonadaceae bacterium]|jgi:DNA repair protein RecO (recombination protein O)